MLGEDPLDAVVGEGQSPRAVVLQEVQQRAHLRLILGDHSVEPAAKLGSYLEACFPVAFVVVVVVEVVVAAVNGEGRDSGGGGSGGGGGVWSLVVAACGVFVVTAAA